jgi:hypothetical protein
MTYVYFYERFIGRKMHSPPFCIFGNALHVNKLKEFAHNGVFLSLYTCWMLLFLVLLWMDRY